VRHLTNAPLVFLDWAAQQMLRPGFDLASAGEMSLPACVDGADEAVAVLRRRHEI